MNKNDVDRVHIDQCPLCGQAIDKNAFFELDKQVQDDPMSFFIKRIAELEAENGTRKR